MNIFEVQAFMKVNGYDPGPIDGIRGRRTIAAIKRFQRDHGLIDDGIVGPRTLSAMASIDSDVQIDEMPVLPWYEEAERMLGVKEVAGPGNSPIIMDWAHALELPHYTGDDIPWCGLFVAHCIGSQLPDEQLPTNVLGARQWRTFGVPTSPRLGAVLVFWRGKPSSWHGHVGFYAGESNGFYHILGGNQSNAVTIAKIGKGRLLEARWPATAGFLNSAPRRVAADNDILVSANEA